MIGLGQLSWFLDSLERHYIFDRSQAYEILGGLSDERYMNLKRMFFDGFASGGGKKENPLAQRNLRNILLNMGVRIDERITKIH